VNPNESTLVAGLDIGTECVKAIVMREDTTIAGTSIVPTHGYFQDCIREATRRATAEAKIDTEALRATCVTGFGAACAPWAKCTVTEAACHARAGFHYKGVPHTLIDIGGREPKTIRVGPMGRVESCRTVRKCAVGVGTFLMFAARHLKVHPTRLMDLAGAAEEPAPIGGYCSVFAEIEVIERLRDGATAESIALGCMHAIADRVLEMGDIRGETWATGGVCEYFPGVVRALRERSGVEVGVLPAPITSGAVGAALFALEESRRA
jgi:predicted CoA-substrate-specific enzyme activase